MESPDRLTESDPVSSIVQALLLTVGLVESELFPSSLLLLLVCPLFLPLLVSRHLETHRAHSTRMSRQSSQSIVETG